MTNSQAFWGGFWSVWDFSRPFDEKPTFHPNGEPFDYQKERKRYRLDENCWDKVGQTLRKAMSQYESEVGIDKIESTT